MTLSYDIDIKNVTNNGSVKCVKFTNSSGTYNVIKYKKNDLTPDNIDTLGKYRSLILKNDNLVCFSPHKSISFDTYKERYPEPEKSGDSNVAEEFIEGTMINIFFDKTIGDDGDWEISTKSNVGGRSVFFREGKVSHDQTFRYMFLEAAGNANLSFDSLSKDYCYSFVLQHPKNRIVVPFSETKLYLIACYAINDASSCVTEVSRSDMEENVKGVGDIHFPKQFSFTTYDELVNNWASDDVDYKIMGVVVKNSVTGDRTKIRNPNYERVRALRGNHAKLQYQYLVLRKDRNVSNYIKYFSEASPTFKTYRDQVHSFTDELFSKYVDCYIKKMKPLKEYSPQYKTHMFNLHKIYINELKDDRKKITRQKVIEYVNNLHPAKLMFSLNYNMNKRLGNSKNPWLIINLN